MIDSSFRMTDCFCLMTSSSGYRTNLVSVTGGVGVFVHILILKGKASWTRSVGGIRQRAHPQRSRQREHDRHATHCAQKRWQLPVGLGVSPRRQEKVQSSRCSARLRGQNKCVFGCDPQSPAAVSLKLDSRLCCDSSTPRCHGRETLDGRCILSPELQLRSAVRQRAGLFTTLRGALIPCDECSSEEGRSLLPRFPPRENTFAHSPYNRPSLQGTLQCRSGWLRLRGISETECMVPVRELVDFSRCSVCEQLNAVERPLARWSLPAPALLDELRWQSDLVPCSGGLGRTDSLCSGRTDSIYDSEPDLWRWDWMWLEIIALVSPDWYLGQRYHSGHGSFSENLSSLTPLPIVAVPFAEVRSPKPTGSQGDRTHRERHHHVPGLPTMTGARSLIDLRFAGQSISGPITKPTLIPVCDVPTVFVPAAFWLSLRLRPIRSRDGRKKEGVVRTFRSRLQETTGWRIPLSLR